MKPRTRWTPAASAEIDVMIHRVSLNDHVSQKLLFAPSWVDSPDFQVHVPMAKDVFHLLLLR